MSAPLHARSFRDLDVQVVTVLLGSVMLVMVQFHVGDRSVFLEHFGPFVSSEWRHLLGWAWWFLWQGLTGFGIPVLLLVGVFHHPPGAVGLGTGDWRFGLLVLLLYLPVAAAGTFVLSAQESFRLIYPHYRMAAYNWHHFFLYEALFLLYWVGWEYLWRGFLLFGTAHRFGLYAIFLQTVPFALLHVNKPLPEALLSIPGGLLLGLLVWRCRSFWIAVPIHAAQMLLLDLWCTLRMRTGVEGVGIEALFELLKAIR